MADAGTGELEVVYREFGAGEYGTMDLFHAPPGTFHAKNLIKSRGGILLPRPGTEQYAATGLPVGVVHAIGYTGVTGRDLWVLIGRTVYTHTSVAMAGSWTAATGLLSSEPNEFCPSYEADGGLTYITVPGQGLYLLNLTSGPGTLTAVAAVTANMAGRAVTIWGERLFLAGYASPANRVYYSEAQDFATWPAANYFDVGYNPQVRHLDAQRDHLAIAKQDGSWWAFTGSTPATGTLRRQTTGQHPWHFWTQSAAITADDVIHYVPVQGSWPAEFDGSETSELRHLEYAPQQGAVAGEQNVVPGGNRDEVVFISGEPSNRGKALFLLEGTWTYHIVGGSIAGGVASDANGSVFLHDGGAVATVPKVYRLNVENPGTPGGTASNSRPGDDSSTPLDTYLELPGWWSEDGQEYRVRQVVVDFRKWDLGVVVNNTIECEVDTYSRHEWAGPKTAVGNAWLEASAGTTAGARDRRLFNVGDSGYGSGFQVRFPQLTGVGIEQVVVKLERHPGKPRS